MIKVHAFGKVFTGAASWNEMDEATLLRIAPVMFMDLQEDERKAVLIYQLFNFGKSFIYKYSFTKKKFFLKQEICNKLFPEVEYLTAKNELTKSVIEKVSVKTSLFKKHTLYTPASNFANITIGEFADAEYWFTQYQDTSDLDCIKKMMAVLYRKGEAALSGTGDCRYKYDFNGNEARFQILQHIEEGYVAAFIVWYMGCRLAFAEDFPILFESKQKKESSEPNLGWLGLIHEMAGPKFGTVEQTATQKLRMVAFEMLNESIKYERMKKENPDMYK